MAILRRLLDWIDEMGQGAVESLSRLFWIFIFILALSPALAAQSVTIIDGSQPNLVIVPNNASTSVGGWIMWRAKFIPEHVIFAFEFPGTFAAVNPKVECSLDDQSQNPNDGSRWVQILLSEPGNGTFDAGGPSVGSGASPSIVLVETGVFPCVSWAIEPAGASGAWNGIAGSKITAVQLPSSGDASFLTFNTGGGGPGFSSGTVRTAQAANQGPVAAAPTPVKGSGTAAFSQDAGNNMFAVPLTGVTNAPDGQPGTVVVTGANNNAVSDFPTHANIRYGGNQSPTGTANAWDRDFYCPKTLSTTGLGAATAQIIPAVAGQKFRICGIIMSNTNATATTVSVTEGTGTNCGTGTSTLLPAITLGANTAANSSIAIFFGNQSPLIGNVSGDAACATGSAAGAVNVAFIFAQY